VGVQNTVSELDREISDIIQEFLSSDDCSEAISSIKNLNVPHYHHQVVFTALALGAEETPKSVFFFHFLFFIFYFLIINYSNLN